MSNHSDDWISDYYYDNELELLERWVEGDKAWALFTDWLFDSKQDTLRENLFSGFLADTKSKQVQAFETWALQYVTEMFESQAYEKGKNIRKYGGLA